MKKNTVVMLIVASLVLMPVLTVVALQTETVPVDISPYYDDSAQVWGNYIVWRRAINVNADAGINFGTEPSWIMVNNIVTGETWNITPANVKSPQSGYTWYEWADVPSIWNGHIIYEYVWGGSGFSYETGIYMYNITSNTTWDVPFPTTYQAGHNCRISGNWIMGSHYGADTAGDASFERQLYLYNYITNEFKTLISDTMPFTAGTLAAYDDFVLYNRYNPNTLVYQVCIFNLSSYQTLILNGTDAGISNLRLGDIYQDKITIYALEVTPTSSWNVYVYDISVVDWTTFGLSTIYFWDSHIYNNSTPIDRDFTSDARGGVIWGEWVVYVDYPGVVGAGASNVRAVNYVSNTMMNLTYNAYRQVVTDIYLDKVVFQDNKNSDTDYGNATDNWDIYRLETNMEAMSASIWNLLPLVMVAMAAIAIGAAAKVMGGSGGGL